MDLALTTNQPTNQSTKYIYSIHVYKQDLALNNLQRLICHKTQTNQTPKLNMNIQYSQSA